MKHRRFRIVEVSYGYEVVSKRRGKAYGGSITYAGALMLLLELEARKG